MISGGLSSLKMSRNPTVNGDWIGSISKQPIWPFPVAEDEGDDLSLLSEESSSSSAVRGMQTKNLASNSMKPNLIGKSHRNEHWKSLGDDINYLCSKQMACANLDLVHEEKYLNGSANYTKEANSLRSKTGHHLKQLSEVLRISEQESLLFEEQCTSVNVSPFHNTSMEMDTASLNGKLFSQPHFYSSPVPMSYPDTESTWKRSKVNSTVKHAPYGSIFAEVQTVDPVHSYASNIFESIRSKLWKQDMQPVHEKEDQLSHSSDISELQKGIQLPGLSGQNNAIQEELRSQARNEASVEKTDLSSGKGKTVDVLEFKDSCSEHEEAKERTPEPIQSLLIARNSPALADEPPPYKESPIKLESYINDTKCYSHSGASVLYQIANNGKENSRSQTRNNVHKGPRTGDQSYQLMLESYVLQLLCVQKILTEASETDIMKKV